MIYVLKPTDHVNPHVRDVREQDMTDLVNIQSTFLLVLL